MVLGEKLKLLLKENNMTQEDLAEQLDVSRQAVGKWVNDKGVPEVNKLIQISNLFGVTLDYLLKDGCYEKGEPAVNSGYYVSREMLEGYFSYHRQNIIKIICGVSLLILPNMFDDFAEGIFLLELFYWLAAAAGIILLLYPAVRIKRYREIKEERLVFDDKVYEDFNRRRELNRKKYAAMIAAGILLLVISSEVEWYLIEYIGERACHIAGWVLDTIWLALILWAALSIHVENIVARNAQKAPAGGHKGRYRFLYIAMPATLLAVLVGFVTNIWSPMAPVILLFCGLLITTCKLLLEGK